MKTNLVEEVNSSFTSSVISKLSALVSEREPNVVNAINNSVPQVLTELLNKVEHGFSPEKLLELAREADSAEVTKHLTDLHSTDSTSREVHGFTLPQDLFNEAYYSKESQVGLMSEIKPSASGTLREVVATAVMGAVGKFAVENDFTSTQLIDWLKAQKKSIGSARLKNIVERTLEPQPYSNVMNVEEPLIEKERNFMRQSVVEHSTGTAANGLIGAIEPKYASGASSELRWQWGVLLLLAVCLGYLFGRGFISHIPEITVKGPQAINPASLTSQIASAGPTEKKFLPLKPIQPATGTDASGGARSLPSKPAPSEAARGRYDQNSQTYVYDTGRLIVMRLPNGKTQKVGENSTENRLYAFLSSTEQVDTVNRTKGWINFDRINFELSKATLKPEANTQLDNIASILNAFPNAVVKIGGYTDDSGDAEFNFRLSEERARVAMLALAQRGVNLNRIQSKGYGPRYFVVSNNTPTDRALNRRISIRVLKK